MKKNVFLGIQQKKFAPYIIFDAFNFLKLF
jgi:hypothetical protein